MAWGYWSATSVSDRGRSPRRDKDKHHATTLHYQQQQQHREPIVVQQSQPQYQQQEIQQQLQQPEEQPQTSHPPQASTAGISLSTSPPIQGGSGLHMQQIQAELAAAAEPPPDPCSRMIQGGSFYSYSAVSAAPRRTGVQVLPRPSFPPSPVESDYEQPSPMIHHSYIMHEEPRESSLIHASSRMKLVRDEDDIVAGLSDPEYDDNSSADVIYTARIDQPGTSAGCLIHGRMPTCRVPLEPAPPPPVVCRSDDYHHHHHQQQQPGDPQFWFDDITWGRSSVCWDDDNHGEYIA